MIEPYANIKNWHPGGTGILICNGPGLRHIPLDFLTKYPTLGCNRITFMHPKFCPTYYFCMGSNQMDTPDKRATIFPTIMDERCKAAFINRLLIQEFAYTNKCYSWLGGRVYGAKDEEIRQFSHNPMMAVGLGYTMAFPILQVAFYMGFETILIVGMDHEYPDTPQKHFYRDDEGSARLFEIAPGPYSVEAWRLGADRVLQSCKDEFDKAKRMIVNLSVPTKCDVFPRQDWKDWA